MWSKVWVTFLYKIPLKVAPALVILFLLFGFALVLKETSLFFHFRSTDGVLSILRGFLSTEWYPEEGQYGILAMVLGSLAVVLLALGLSLPLSFFSAISIVFFLPRTLAAALQQLLQLFAGIPSVMIGLFGLVTLIPALSSTMPIGFGLASAGIILAIVLLPHTCIQICEVIENQCTDIMLSGQSLGFSRSGSIVRLLIPERLPILCQTILLAASRGLGETLAVMMVAGNIVNLPSGLFEPFRTLNATIALEMPYAAEAHRGSLFILGVLTFMLVLVLRGIARGVGRIRFLDSDTGDRI